MAGEPREAAIDVHERRTPADRLPEPRGTERGDRQGPTVGGELERDPAPHRVARDVRAVDAERVHPPAHGGGEVARRDVVGKVVGQR